MPIGRRPAVQGAGEGPRGTIVQWDDPDENAYIRDPRRLEKIIPPRPTFGFRSTLARNGIKGDKATIECIGQLPKRPER